MIRNGDVQRRVQLRRLSLDQLYQGVQAGQDQLRRVIQLRLDLLVLALAVDDVGVPVNFLDKGLVGGLLDVLNGFFQHDGFLLT